MRKYKPRSDSHQENKIYYSPTDFMEEVFWETNFHKFTALARRRIATLPWYRQFSGRAVGGMEPADYVLRVAELLMSGQRRAQTQYSRETCVHGILDSLIFHDFQHLENAFAHDSISVEAEGGGVHDTLSAPHYELDDAIAAKEHLETFKECFADEKQRAYLELLASGQCETAADAAVILDVPESTVRNYIKVVRRRRNQWPGATPAKNR